MSGEPLNPSLLGSKPAELRSTVSCMSVLRGVGFQVGKMFRASLAPRLTHGGGLLYSAALFTLGAATIHFVVMPEHLREYVPYGLFFLVVAIGQVFLAVELVARPSRPLALVGATGSLALVSLWAVSRPRVCRSARPLGRRRISASATSSARRWKSPRPCSSLCWRLDHHGRAHVSGRSWRSEQHRRSCWRWR